MSAANREFDFDGLCPLVMRRNYEVSDPNLEATTLYRDLRGITYQSGPLQGKDVTPESEVIRAIAICASCIYHITKSQGFHSVSSVNDTHTYPRTALLLVEDMRNSSSNLYP